MSPPFPSEQELYRELIYDGINVDVMHAERSAAQREEVIRRFRAGEIWVLICTDLMARGLWCMVWMLRVVCRVVEHTVPLDTTSTFFVLFSFWYCVHLVLTSVFLLLPQVSTSRECRW